MKEIAEESFPSCWLPLYSFSALLNETSEKNTDRRGRGKYFLSTVYARNIGGNLFRYLTNSSVDPELELYPQYL